jgi:hypothetical protein
LITSNINNIVEKDKEIEARTALRNYQCIVGGKLKVQARNCYEIVRIEYQTEGKWMK